MGPTGACYDKFYEKQIKTELWFGKCCWENVALCDTKSNFFSEQVVQVLTFSDETNSTHLYQLHILRFSEKEVKQMLDTSSISGLSSLPAALGSVCFALHALHFKLSTEYQLVYRVCSCILLHFKAQNNLIKWRENPLLIKPYINNAFNSTSRLKPTVKYCWSHYCYKHTFITWKAIVSCTKAFVFH